MRFPLNCWYFFVRRFMGVKYFALPAKKKSWIRPCCKVYVLTSRLTKLNLLKILGLSQIVIYTHAFPSPLWVVVLIMRKITKKKHHWEVTNRAGFKFLTPLGPSFLAPPDQSIFSGWHRDLRGNHKNSGIAEALRRRHPMSNEPKVMQERGDTELSAVIFGIHRTVYKRLQNSCVLLKSLFWE